MIQLSVFQVSLSCRILGLNIYQEGQCVNSANSQLLCWQGRERRKEAKSEISEGHRLKTHEPVLSWDKGGEVEAQGDEERV